MAFRDFLRGKLGRGRRLTDLLGDQAFVRGVCEEAGFDSLEDENLDALVEECMDEAERLGFRKDQLFAKFADGVLCISNVGAVGERLGLIRNAVRAKSKEWGLFTIEPVVITVAYGIVAAYYVEGLIQSGVYVEQA